MIEVRALPQERQDRRKAELTAHRRDVSSPWGTRCSSTPSTPSPLSRHARCSRHAGWAPSRCSRARRPTPTALMSRRRGASSPNSTSNVCALPARARRAGPAHCRRGPGGVGGAGAAQVPDALRPPARAGGLGGPRSIWRHAGAAGVADSDQLRGGPHRLQTSYRPRPASAAAPADRFHRRRGSAGGPGGGARGPAAAIVLVAGRWLAARYGRPSLPARRVLARGGVHAPDVGAARHGGLSARRRLLLCPVGAALSCPRRRRRGRVSAPPTPTQSFSLVGGSSQSGPAQSGPTAAVPCLGPQPGPEIEIIMLKRFFPCPDQCPNELPISP
jgi:hypothetical protein